MDKQQERMMDLESRLAFQEDAIDHLNKTVAKQRDEIDLLQQQIRYVYGQIKQLSEQQSLGSVNDVPPPHY